MGAGRGQGLGAGTRGSPVLQQEGGDGRGGASTGVRAAGRAQCSPASPPSPSPARPRSCAVGLTVPGAVPVPGPGAGATCACTRTHTAGAEALRASDAQLSPCFREPAGKAAGGNPAPAMFRKGAPTRKKGWGGFPGVAADFFFFLTMSIHGLKSKGIPKRGGE